MLKSRITRHEWRNVALFALLIIVITTLPYALGYLKQDNQWRFSGFLFGVEDGNSYVGKMRLGARGILDFYLFYTPEPHASAPFVFLPYILPGWLVGRFITDHDPMLFQALTLTYHLMQIIFNLLFIVVLYRFIAVFIKQPRTRMLALILATFGGGFGWLLTFLGSTPAEFFIPEGFSWLILLGLPHLALARAALLGGFLFLFKGISQYSAGLNSEIDSLPRLRGRAREGVGGSLSTQHSALSTSSTSLSVLSTQYSVLAAACWLIVGLTVPFYLPIIYVILATWGLVLWIAQRRFPREFTITGGIAAVITLPLFAYFTYTFASNPIFAVWSSQNILQSPPPLDYVAAYILLVAFALVAGRWLWRKIAAKQSPYFALLMWPLVVPILVYLPLNVQRRMAEAVIVPLAILAAVGLRFLKRQPRWKRVYRPAVVVMCMSSAVFLLFMFFGVLSPSRPVFRPTAELATLNWLNNNAPADSVILTAFDTGKLSPSTDIDTGNLIPAYSNLRPYVGHGPETAHATDKDALTRRFFADEMTTDERRSLYSSVDIRYIFYGPLEKVLLIDASATPAWQSDAQKIYDTDGYQIWQIQ